MSGAASAGVPQSLPPQVLMALLAQMRARQGAQGAPSAGGAPQMPPGPPMGGPPPGGPPPGGPPPGGPPPGGPPQIPPQILQALLAAKMGGQGGPPGGPQPGMPPGMPPGAPPGAGVAPRMQPPPSSGGPVPTPVAPGMQQLGQAAAGGIGMQPPAGGRSAMSPAEMARLGRNGDTIVAHLTPGEIAIPPEVQHMDPKLMQELARAFAKAHVSQGQFTAGNPQSSINPRTGEPEYNLLSALLPIALGVIGSVAAPGIGSALGVGLGSAALGAIGGGLGSAAGSLLSGGGLEGAAMSGLSSGLGGYMLGGAGSAGANAANAATGQTLGQGAIGGGGNDDPFVGGWPATNAPFGGGGGAATSAASGGLKGILSGLGSAGAPVGAGLGALLGGALAPQAPPSTLQNNTQLPAGFNTPLPPTNVGDAASLGSRASVIPNFAGYDPIKAATQGGFDFYHPQANGPPVWPGQAPPGQVATAPGTVGTGAQAPRPYQDISSLLGPFASVFKPNPGQGFA